METQLHTENTARQHRSFIQRLVRPVVLAWTRPAGLSWSDEHSSYVLVRRSWCVEWTSLWQPNEWGRWECWVSYGKDLPLNLQKR